MTNSEAIKVLKDLRAFDDDCDEDCKAIDIAISSLEENDKLKAEIEQLKNRTEIENSNFELYSDALDEIERLNSIIDACNKMAKEIVLIAEQHLKSKV